VKPATNTLSEIFQAPVRLVVPIYQRPYVWEQEPHWQPLWEDIQAVLERYRDGDPEQLRHFLGAVVLDQEDTPPGEAPRRLIIDGQQRLTTIQLLFAAAARNAEEDGAEQYARLLTKLIQNDPDLTTGDDRFKVWPTNVDQATFREVMTTDTAVTGRISEVHRYFRQAMREWLAEGDPGPEELRDRHKALWVTLSSLLQIVSINLEPGDNAQVIFETLNARGTPLLAMDLVKNVAFYRAQRDGADVDLLNDTVWEPELGSEYWRKTVRQGRLNRPRAELFLMHWLAMKLGRIIPATELFSEFRAHIIGAPNASRAEALIRELCSDAAVLRSFDDQPQGTVEEAFFRRLDALDTTTVIPVALLLYRSPEVSDVRRRTGLRALESWLVRRMLNGLTAQGYNRLMADLLKAVRADLPRADEVIVSFLRGSSANSAVWPTDEMLSVFLESRNLYGYISQKRIVMVLSAVELERRKEAKTEDIYSLPINLTVEHIMPQTWQENWSMPSDEDPANREARIHRLGNLTLTSGPLNSALSNARWEKKRPELLAHTLLRINQELAPHEAWDEASIDARGKELAHEVTEIWPAPEDPSWPRGAPALQEPTQPLAANSASSGSPAMATESDSDPTLTVATTPTPSDASTTPSRLTHDGRDFSRFHVVVDGQELADTNKRNSVRTMVSALFEQGVPMAKLADELGNHVRWVEGEPPDLESAFRERYPQLDPAWWYLDHPLHDGERTWFVDKAWGRETESTLKSLATAFPRANVGFRKASTEPAHESSREPAATIRVPPRRVGEWQPAGTIDGFVAHWPEGDEPYGSLSVYEAPEELGRVRLAIGEPKNRLVLYGRERGWLSVWLVSGGKPARQLANFLETDNFAETGLRAVLISGKKGNGKGNYLPSDEGLLPDGYRTMRLGVHREHIDGPMARNRLVVLAGDDNIEAMLDHAFIQLYLRTGDGDSRDGQRGAE
jgi:hypothetical protein